MRQRLRERLGRGSVSVHERLAANPAIAVIALALLLAFVALGLARFHIGTQMTDALPEGAERDRMLAVMDHFKLASVLLIHVEDEGEEPRPDALVGLVDELASALEEGGRFKHLFVRVAPDEQERIVEAIFPRRYVLLPDDEVLERVSAEGVRRGIARVTARLISPQSGFAEPMLRRDPLGFSDVVLERLLTGQQQFAVELYHGHLVSADRRHALVLAEPEGQGMDLAPIQETLDEVRGLVDDLLARPEHRGLRVGLTGGPVFSVASAGIVRGDVQRAMGATGIGILLVFVALFGRLRVMALAFAPPVLGVAVGIAVLGVARGEVHGLGLGFGAAMLGITVDYTIHLFTRTLQLEVRLPRSEAVRRALAEVTPSLGMGCLTTLIGFGVIQLSDTQVLRDMSTLALGGISAAFVLCVVLTPLAYRRLAGRRGGGHLRRVASLGRGLERFGASIDRRPWPYLAVWLVTTAAAAVLATGLRFDGDIRNLDHQPPDVLEEERRFQEAFGAGASGAMVVAEGADLESALAANDRLAEILSGGVRRGELSSVSTVADLLPSAATQRRRLALVAGEDPGRLIRTVEEEAARAGFVEGYFAPFGEELRSLARGDVPPLVLDDLRETAMGEMLARRIAVTGDLVQVLTLVETAGAATGAGGGSAAELERGVFPHGLAAEIERRIPGTIVISFPDLAARLVVKVRGDVVRLAGVSLAALVVVLLVYYRRPLPALVALAPCLASLAWTAGLLSLSDVPLNVMNVCGVAITLGVSIDYGIFMVDRMDGGEPGGEAAWPPTRWARPGPASSSPR